MKKILAIAVSVMTVVAVQAASIGWNVSTGNASYAGNAYQVFVIGQNSVTSLAQITALLDLGTDVSSYAFGSGALNASGAGIVSTSVSGKKIVPDTFPATLTSFAVIYDSSTITKSSSKYVAISGQTNQTKTLANSTSASATFATGNVSSIVADSKNWKSFGPVPEPCSAALIALGVAVFGLKRKIA